MKTIRQDAWTAADDVKLAEMVLRHIREGSTQLAAFEESAELLRRTSAACGYRWNACVRKQYQEAIHLAKVERKQRRDDHPPEGGNTEEIQSPPINWNVVLRFIREYRHEFHALQGRVKQLERDSDSSRLEVERLRKDKSELLRQLRKLSEEHLVISDDYRALLMIVDRARRRQIDENDVAAGPIEVRLDAVQVSESATSSVSQQDPLGKRKRGRPPKASASISTSTHATQEKPEADSSIV